MKVGLFVISFEHLGLDGALKKVKELGLDTVELPVPATDYPNTKLAYPPELLSSKAKLEEFGATFEKYGISISAVSCHSNPLDPRVEVAAKSVEYIDNAILLAEKLGVDTVVTFSGCPGGCPQDRTPNWIVTPVSPDLQKALQWQWQEKVIPFWQEKAKLAADHNTKIALELHPVEVVYNARTMLKIRQACGDNLGANVDPGQLFWQGIDPVAVVRELKEAVFFVHIKDTQIDPYNCRVNGVLDTTAFEQLDERCWSYRTVGYGHGAEFWCNFVSALQMIGYRGALSIEHEDLFMTIEEGIFKGKEFIDAVMIKEAL